MLVLSRKVGEEILIADHIRVTVVAIQGNKVRIGFTAPPDVSIYREELVPRLRSSLPREPHAMAR
jgi:carbon storage regulator